MLQLLRWESPPRTVLAYSLVQWLVLTDRFYYLPSIGVAYLYLTVRQAKRGTHLPTPPETVDRGSQLHQQAQSYCVEYYHREPGLRTKLGQLQSNIEMVDALLEKIVMRLLKLHSAFAGVDEQCVLENIPSPFSRTIVSAGQG